MRSIPKVFRALRCNLRRMKASGGWGKRRATSKCMSKFSQRVKSKIGPWKYKDGLQRAWWWAADITHNIYYRPTFN